MSLPIDVRAYSRYRPNERPLHFCLDEDLIDIAKVEDRWYDPDAEYFRVLSSKDKHYILRCSREGEWTLQSGFDGDELLARPSIELVSVNPGTIREAELKVAGCEGCRGDEADHLFDSVLADVMGKHGAFEFVLTGTARCPNCHGEPNTRRTFILPKAVPTRLAPGCKSDQRFRHRQGNWSACARVATWSERSASEQKAASGFRGGS